MATGQGNGQTYRDELERVLSSACFARSERTSKLLRFLVERQLAGRENELKESAIGVDVFGRSPDYDPKVDSTVRSEAVRLRARLSKYYSTEGRQDPIVIDLPKGGYVPSFRQPEPAPGVQSVGPKRLWLAAGLAGFVVTTAAIGAWWVLRKNAPIPIGVIPLVNLSQDPGNEYFADGLTDEIIRNLSIIEGLAVRSQTSSFAFKGKPRNLAEAGRQLGADYILEGSVLRAGQQLRVNAHLVRVRDDFPLWSGRFDRELTDIFVIQDEISRGIVNSLRLKLGRGRRRYETSAEAYDLYLRARALPLQRNLRGYDESIGPLEEAIAKDPSFAPAYAGLAAARAVRSGQFRFDLADESFKMRSAAEKAIQLDPLLAEAHEALGMAYAHDAKWDQSEKSFRHAIELDPNRSITYAHFALFLLWPLGRIDEAIQQLRIAQKADPLSPAIQVNLSNALIAAGRYEEAAGICQKLPEQVTGRSQCLGRVRLGEGRIGEAIQIFETAFNRGVGAGSEVRGGLGYAYARAGRRDDAEKLAASTPSINPFNRAIIFAGLGDKDRTFAALDLAAAAGPFRIGRALTFPEFAVLRGDPRVKALRKRVGLPQ
jgi:serine/threonine-protein kinase